MMRNFMYAAASIAIVMAGPALAQGKGNGNGNGHQGQGPAHAGKPDHGNGQANGKGPKMDRGPSGPERIAKQIGNPGKGNGKADRGPANRNDIREQVRGAQRDIENGVSRRVQQARRDIRGNIDEARRDVTLRGNDVVRPRDRYDFYEDGRLRFGDRRQADYGLINGCPPGLAKKNNGCLPPGQARKLYDQRQAYYRDDRGSLLSYLGLEPRFRDSNFVYSDGYAYRMNNNNSLVTAFLPLVGGALFQGQTWPQQYGSQAAPTYYSDYYGRNNPNYTYRYADDTLFGVNPQNDTISTIAALLTGNNFAVGQPMPAGYDVYNVPYQYRDRYYDRPDAMYRYSDGYVYQVDPKTRLIQSVIQLLT
ncbi:hypothetical protein [Novosphingopyxis iocasae]|uniref:hypothetical protein n=1 Tax=Novosphingopyxis iocasae TaxID=2762729 RepID=UPI001BE4DD78|nr:hypothetical protein [Novosphingopyxis iocasae]